ncbi:hypothetical protein [Methylophilus sp. Leaf414]|uniref:hypothetical protein n=1 Tax=Methylophilus sp. Leaf414 TaxID=1736371 RepID=UPI0006FB70DC|nr:hypothetical protein [Methylophilus sp. Leaf414]KQT34154.1 hypothetical protein ASG24_10420 [Methylophilus sp. Leaf414]
MNQSNLYATLSKAGFKIITFEDYPTNQGSWRASFMKSCMYCEISCNRYDGYLSLQAKRAGVVINKSVINSLKFLTDEAELNAVISWLRFLQNNSKTNNNKVFISREMASTY